MCAHPHTLLSQLLPSPSSFTPTLTLCSPFSCFSLLFLLILPLHSFTHALLQTSFSSSLFIRLAGGSSVVCCCCLLMCSSRLSNMEWRVCSFGLLTRGSSSSKLLSLLSKPSAPVGCRGERNYYIVTVHDSHVTSILLLEGKHAVKRQLYSEPFTL